MKKLILLAAAALLPVAATAGTATGFNPTKGVDGFFFKQKEFEMKTMEVTLVTYKYNYQFEQAYEELNGVKIKKGQELVAFAQVQPNEGKCTIHAVDPGTDYKPEFLGHELAHCFYGRFHR